MEGFIAERRIEQDEFFAANERMNQMLMSTLICCVESIGVTMLRNEGPAMPDHHLPLP
jgi:hypothetical protein